MGKKTAMRGAEIKKNAEDFGISVKYAIKMRIRYLTEVICQIPDYIENGGEIPPMELGEAIDEILALKRYKANMGKPLPAGSITDEMVQAARDYPITNLFEFKSGRTQCPFHNSKGPDLSYHAKSNTVRCFGSCGKSWDTIGVLQERDGLSFIEAVKQLSN